MIQKKKTKDLFGSFFTYLYFLLFSLRNFKEIYIMCGIIGFTGNLQAPGILVDGYSSQNTEDMTVPESQ